MTQKPLELILARNLMSALSTPAFLVDEGGLLVFYNEAAGSLLGKRFEELGTVGPEEWGSLFGPFDESGEPIPYDELPLVDRGPQRPPRARRPSTIRSADGALHEVEASAFPILTAHGSQGAIAVFWPSGRRRATGGAAMKVKLWGTRGSIPSPGPETIRYGGNTSCVGVTLSDGSLLALDAGTGIRSLGLALADEPARLHILLTHLHLDHIQGLVFFAPAFRPQTEIVIWGPGLARGLAARPHRPLHLGAALAGRGARAALRRLLPPLPGDRVGDRPGADPRRLGRPTAGRRSATGSTTATPRSPTSPTTSRPSAPTSTALEEDWISGFDLARDASLLIHDGQYADAEYPDHVGWGHSALSHALAFARRTGGRAHRCSSTTTRCTPTSSSTTSAGAAQGALGGARRRPERGRAGHRAGRARDLAPPGGCRRCRPRRTCTAAVGWRSLYEQIRYEQRGHVALITIDRPERMNAIGPVTSRELIDAWARFRDDDEARVAVITGAGESRLLRRADLKAAAAGFSDQGDEEPLVRWSARGGRGPQPRRARRDHRALALDRHLQADRSPPSTASPTPAGWSGPASPTSAIADEHASFGVTCRRWNIGLGDGGTQRLPRIVGMGRAMELIITGRVIGAAEAERIGLVNEVTPSGGCVERALELAEAIAELPQPAIRTDKEAAVRGYGRPLDEGLRIEAQCFNKLLTSPEMAEGIRRFVERDHPDRDRAGGSVTPGLARGGSDG